VRVVAATHRDLSGEVAAGRFRRDLYFRLVAAVVAVPTLRSRPEDLPLLVEALLADLDKPRLRVSDAAYQTLRAHAWPGNVRELKNALACAVAFVEEGSALEPQHLRLEVPAGDDDVLERLPLAGQRLEHIEKAAIKLTLAQVGGNKVQAARLLGIAVSTLYEKLKKYGLN
jgi:transcriptional regulator with PAS, ATPase and Fis domain